MRLCYVALAAVTCLTPRLCPKTAKPFAGRWDITVSAGATVYPDWMEVMDKDPVPDVRIQPRAGSVRPVKDVRTEGAHLVLTVNPGVTWDLTVSGNSLTGVQ